MRIVRARRLEAARRWARGEATLEEVRFAYDAADAAYAAYAAAAAARNSELAVMADIVRAMLTIPEVLP